MDPQAAGLDLDQFEMVADPQRATEDEIAVDAYRLVRGYPVQRAALRRGHARYYRSSPPVRPGNVLPLSTGRLLAAANARRIHCLAPRITLAAVRRGPRPLQTLPLTPC